VRKDNRRYNITNRQARRFVLLRQGLLGEHRYLGRQGALDFIRGAGCIQFDPVDICGRNAELTLQSRVKGFDKAMLDGLLYTDRLLVDYPDKQLAIIPVEHWPFFERYREAARQGGMRFEGIAAMEKEAIAFIKVNGPVSSAELPFEGIMHWHSSIHWSGGWDGLLVDYPDKQLAIIPVEHWPFFERYREAARQGGLRFEGIAAMEKEALAFIEAKGPVSSAELPFEGIMHWHSAIHWSGGWDGKTNAARAVLEHLYSTGRLVIHRKKGTRKYYDLAERHIPPKLLAAPEPFPDEGEHLKWRVLRRIGAVGLLWNRPSDAWLHIWGLKNDNRADIFQTLVESGEIIPVAVEGIKDDLYCLASDGPLMAAVLQNRALKPRMELIAPLDCLMWDRKLVRALFGFSYTWEIYIPAHRRKFGAYVLPLLYGDTFVGRVEAVCERKAGVLSVRNVWFEDGLNHTKKLQSALGGCLKRFARFNGCGEIAGFDV